MKSRDEMRTDYGIETHNASSDNLAWGTRIMDQFHRRLLAAHNWPFKNRLRTATTVADTDFVDLPYGMLQVESVFVTVSDTRYSPTPVKSRQQWDELHYSSYSSDIPEYWFQYNDQIGLWPTPASAGNVISINGRVRVPDLTLADYETGTVDIITNGDETVTGSGTTWTTPMGGRWLRIDQGDTAAASGDGIWYEIDSVTSATELELVRPYGGASLTTGAAASYTIGQMTLLPEDYHDLPVIYAAERYWLKEQDARADAFRITRLEIMSNMMKTYGVNDLSMVIDDGRENEIVNPNNFITL